LDPTSQRLSLILHVSIGPSPSPSLLPSLSLSKRTKPAAEECRGPPHPVLSRTVIRVRAASTQLCEPQLAPATTRPYCCDISILLLFISPPVAALLAFPSLAYAPASRFRPVPLPRCVCATSPLLIPPLPTKHQTTAHRDGDAPFPAALLCTSAVVSNYLSCARHRLLNASSLIRLWERPPLLRVILRLFGRSPKRRGSSALCRIRGDALTSLQVPLPAPTA
ncbi:uncharacterized protein BDR25DRAFT_331328, partial [Lindgomyces ingoldianus]